MKGESDSRYVAVVVCTVRYRSSTTSPSRRGCGPQPPSAARAFLPVSHFLFGPPRQPDEEITERHYNVAASVQKALEETVLRVLVDLKNETTTLDNLSDGRLVARMVLLREEPCRPVGHQVGRWRRAVPLKLLVPITERQLEWIQLHNFKNIADLNELARDLADFRPWVNWPSSSSVDPFSSSGDMESDLPF